MPIDINLLRVEKLGDPDVIRQSEQLRGRDPKVVDHIIAIDKNWRENLFCLEKKRKELNDVNGEISQAKKKDPNFDHTHLETKIGQLKADIKELNTLVKTLEKERDETLKSIGNILHQKNFIFKSTGSYTHVIRTFNPTSPPFEKKNDFPMLSHHEIMGRLNILDLDRGTRIAGHRGYCLKGFGVQLNLALIQYGLNFLTKKGYVGIQPPFFMKREIMAETAELQDFDETLYKISDKEVEKEDLFLIATSEQPISALHRGETLSPTELPLKYAGVSTCFRKEAGAHGKDMRGIFRTHQFEKVEQFVITTPDASEDAHEEMIKIAEEFYKGLNLAYRVVLIPPDDLNNAAAIKYDLEAWFPSYNDYRELVSCSNCTDYQSRELSVRLELSKKTDPAKQSRQMFVHMLNATLCATERTMTCILENYQDGSGVHIPKVLWRYFDDLHYVPYVQ